MVAQTAGIRLGFDQLLKLLWRFDVSMGSQVGWWTAIFWIHDHGCFAGAVSCFCFEVSASLSGLITKSRSAILHLFCVHFVCLLWQLLSLLTFSKFAVGSPVPCFGLLTLIYFVVQMAWMEFADHLLFSNSLLPTDWSLEVDRRTSWRQLMQQNQAHPVEGLQLTQHARWPIDLLSICFWAAPPLPQGLTLAILRWQSQQYLC